MLICDTWKMFNHKKYNLLLFFSHLPAKMSMGFQSAETNYLFANFDNPECIQAFISGGINVSVRDNTRQTALF